MYFSKIAVLAAATMASTVVADNCFAGYAYCSGNLLTQGSSSRHLTFPPSSPLTLSIILPATTHHPN